MEILDIFLGTACASFIYFFAILYRSKYLRDSPLRKFFMAGLTLKFIGAVAAGMVYKFYYTTGDTFIYYEASIYLNKLLDINFASWWKSIMTKADGNLINTYVDINVLKSDKTFFFVKMCAILGLITYNNYTVSALIFALFSFACSWKFYKMLCDLYPSLTNTFGYCVFYIPSVIFWGSGLFKDTITYSCIILFTAAGYSVFMKKDRIFVNVLLIILSIYFLQNIREFLLLTILPTFLVWRILQYKKVLKNEKIRFFIGPVFMILGFGIAGFAVSSISKSDEQLQTESLKNKSKGFQNWHSAEGAGGSSYSLGEMDYTTTGILKKVPAAVNVSLFRPYLFEVTNGIMLIASLESLFFLLLFLGIIKDVKFGFLFYFFDNPNVFFFLTFAIVFAFIAGFNSYNFGALVRYKIPCMPYFLIGLYICKYEIRMSKERLDLARAIKMEEREEMFKNIGMK